MPAKREELIVALPQKEVVYWAPASRFQIANFRKEERAQSGHIRQSEMPLTFTENIFVTDDPEKIAFIEASNSFKNGSVRRCENMEEARSLSIIHFKKKTIKTYRSEVDESQRVDIDKIPPVLT